MDPPDASRIDWSHRKSFEGPILFEPPMHDPIKSPFEKSRNPPLHPLFHGIPDSWQDQALGRPLNPNGPTGLRGRGTLWKWGPNDGEAQASNPQTRLERTSELWLRAGRRSDGHPADSAASSVRPSSACCQGHISNASERYQEDRAEDAGSSQSNTQAQVTAPR
eukprot:7335106-Prymnesium_polylepis.1